MRSYTVGELLHTGKETRVFRARAEDGAPVVLKCSLSEPATAREMGRIHHEHAVLRELGALPGLVTLHGLDELNGTLRLVLQDPGARSLDSILEERRTLPVPHALRLCLALARTLDAVHQAGILHKDIKPQNLLVDESIERVWLIDFGIASRLSFEATTALVPEALEGTLAYISPEQTGRTARSLDARTDLYSLGVVFFELLAGRRPFLETDALALVHAHLAKSPPALEALAPEVPANVARIVTRLLAKDPERRYQTAKGLAHDLAACLAPEPREAFPLGTRDFSPKLRLPDVLVGRDAEVQTVKEAFGRAAKGGAELLLLGGPSGIGKTALVRAVYKHIAAAGRGVLLSGKHDQLARSTPYAALTQAFGGAMQQVAAAPSTVVHAWKQRLIDRVGINLPAIVALIPELEWITGKLPELQELPAEQSFNRLKMAWAEFVLAVAELSQPVVLFLDDLQWVDPASVELLKRMLTDPRRAHVLVILAYRDNETEAGHPLWTLVDHARKQGTEVARLQVGPLAPREVAGWLGLTLDTSPERAAPLAKILSRKTAGNPFFLGQLLLAFYEQKQVKRNLDTGEWSWELGALEAAQITDNVVTLMRQKLDELALASQQLLGLAGCVGYQFSFAELQRLSGQDARSVSGALWPALHAGLVVPVDARYRETHAVADAAPELPTPDARYQFLHDRVQQACYERIPAAERGRAHLDIGRRLRTHYQEHGGTSRERLELVRHLNLGLDQIEERTERVELARLNLQVAQEAKKSGVYQLMLEVLERAVVLLGQARWETDFDLAAQVAADRLEAAYFTKDWHDLESRAVALSKRPLQPLEYWRTQELRLRSKVSSGDYPGGAVLGREVFPDLAQGFPRDEAGHAVFAEQGKALTALLAARALQGWDEFFVDTSPVTETEELALAHMWVCLLFSGAPTDAAFTVASRIRGSLEKRAVSRSLPVLIGYFGGGLPARDALHVASAGVRLAAQTNSPHRAAAENPRALCMFAEHPAREATPFFDAVTQQATASGAPIELSVGHSNPVQFVFLFAGDPLSFIVGESEKRLRVIERLGEVSARQWVEPALKFASRLMENVPWDEAEGLFVCGSQALFASGAVLPGLCATTFEAQFWIHQGHFGEVLRVIPEPRAALALQMSTLLDGALWSVLSSSRLFAETTEASGRAKLLDNLEFGLALLRTLSQGCRENFGHKLALLEAEKARIEGRIEQAMAKYDEAIEYARAQRFLHIEALSAQFCADFHLAAGRTLIGRTYLHVAIEAYTRWGALRVVRHLCEKHAELLRVGTPAPPAVSATTAPTALPAPTTTTTLDGAGQLDVGTAVRAAQALSRELSPQRVVVRLMDLVLENAGAQRGVLLLGSPDALRPKARFDAERNAVDLAPERGDAADVAATVVSFVARAATPLLLGDARADVRFNTDPHVLNATARALLVVPLQQLGKLSGVLYLEHDTPHAFPPARVALITVLAAQAATALQNARLYEELRHASLELQRVNEGLEAKVVSRTAELQKVLSDLWSEMDLAQKIQTVLLPSDPQISGYEIAATMRPADQVGGDYYDVFRRGGQDWVLIGDVAGHGVPAGLCMMMIQAVLRAVALTLERSHEPLLPSRLLGLVNEAVESNLKQIGRGHYMTITALCIQGETVRYAGLHQDLLIYRAASHQVERIETQGIWLGVAEGDISEVLPDQELRLNPGDVLLLYTDGYTEAKIAGHLLETQGLCERFADLCRRALPTAALIEGLLDGLKQAVVPDDVTLVALRRVQLCAL